MKYIITHKDGKVIDFRTTGFDITVENLAVTDGLPEFVPQGGYNGVLCYNETNGLYWEYEEAPESDELTDSQALYILTGGAYGEA